MRVKRLADIRRPSLLEIPLGRFPDRVIMTGYALNKALAVSALVREIHGGSYEWYGLTLGEESRPEVITDIGLPRNAANLPQYTSLDGADLLAFQEELDTGRLVNGWIHSHGDLNYHGFSPVDEANHRVVLDYVASRVRRPLVKKEVRVEGLTLAVADEAGTRDLRDGTVTILTDVPVTSATILETVYGAFCFAVLIGDSGWILQRIVTKTRGILTGTTGYGSLEAPLVIAEPQRALTEAEKEDLREEVQRKIRPPGADPPEHLERL